MKPAISQKALKRSKTRTKKERGNMNYTDYFNKHSSQVWLIYIIYAYLAMLISIFAYGAGGLIVSILYSTLLIVVGVVFLRQILPSKSKR
ncbi:MAG: hypothetical protein AABX51_07310 [Nanoarchaeota archaeon]